MNEEQALTGMRGSHRERITREPALVILSP
jgi:hypothetical protein